MIDEQHLAVLHQLLASVEPEEVEALQALLAAVSDESKSTSTAKQRYDELNVDADEDNPIERLRAFCSLAMNGQDWLDVEPFFTALVSADYTAKQVFEQTLRSFAGWLTTRKLSTKGEQK